MRPLSSLIALLAVVFMLSGPSLAGETKSVTLKVEGMTCKLCVPAVKKSLSDLEGVKSVDVSLEQKKAYVEYEEGTATVQKMIDAVKDAGYDAGVLKGD